MADCVLVAIEFARSFDLCTTPKASQNLKYMANFSVRCESLKVVSLFPILLKIQGDTMKKLTKACLLTIVAFAAIFATGCPQQRSIAEIERNPGRYANKEVVIVGVVKDTYGVSVPGTPIRGGVYKIDDGTGSIWVVTDNTVPGKGSEIGIKGRVGTGVSWNGRNYGLGVFEDSRRYKKR
jgi:hypothetical protein